MLRKTIGRIWKSMSPAMRTRLVRITQTKFTVSAAVIVVNERQEVLLLDHVLRPRSGWGFPGGLLDAGEQILDALKREVREEIGIDLENVKFKRARTVKRHLELLYTANPVGTPEVLSREIYQLRWFSPDDLPAGLTADQRRLILEAIGQAV
jgi:8-oxo-dGTP diphosphatase